jgi:hypothetical protein
LESNQPFGLFRPALIRLSYPTELERAVRLELTNTGFAIQRLSHLATRAVWRGRRDSNSRVEFGRLACFQLHHFRVGRESGRPAFCGGVRTLHNKLEHRTGFEPVSQHWQRRVLNQLDQRCEMVGEDRVELSPRVPRTRMRTLHHTPKLKLVRQVRLELTLPCLRGRCLNPIWLLTHGGTERTRTVMGLIDNQVPNPSATVPCEKVGWVEGS